MYIYVNTFICMHTYVYTKHNYCSPSQSLSAATTTTINCLDGCIISVVSLNPSTANELHRLTLSTLQVVSQVQIVHCSHSEKPHFHNGPQYTTMSGPSLHPGFILLLVLATLFRPLTTSFYRCW